MVNKYLTLPENWRIFRALDDSLQGVDGHAHDLVRKGSAMIRPLRAAVVALATVVASPTSATVIFESDDAFGSADGGMAVSSNASSGLSSRLTAHFAISNGVTDLRLGDEESVTQKVVGSQSTMNVPPASVAPKSRVPEPATWVLLMMGFAAAGYAVRQRRKIRIPQVA